MNAAISRRCLCLCVALECASAPAAPSVGPAIAVDTPAGTESLNSYEFDLSFRSSSSHFILGWKDERAGEAIYWGSLIDADGGVPIPSGRIINTINDFGSAPAARPTLCAQAADVWWVTSVATGASPVSGVIRTTPTLQRQSASRVSGGDNANVINCRTSAPLLAWAYSPWPYLDYALMLQQLVPDAGLVDVPNAVPLVGAMHVLRPMLSYDLASDGTNAYLVWADGRAGALDAGGSTDLDVYLATVTPTGMSTTTVVAAGARDQSEPRISVNAGSIAIVWLEGSPSSQHDVWVTLNGVSQPVTSSTEEDSMPRIVFDGSQWVIVWRTTIAGANELRARTLSAAGLLGATQTVVRSSFDDLQVDTNGNGVTAAAYRDFLAGIHHKVVLLNGSSTRVPPFDPVVTGLSQTEPRLVASPTGAAVLWLQQGAWLSTQATTTPSASPLSHQPAVNVTIGSNGSEFIVVDGYQGATIYSPTFVQTRLFSWAAGLVVTNLTAPKWDGRNFRFVSRDYDGVVRLHTVSTTAVAAPATQLPSLARDIDFDFNDLGSTFIFWDVPFEVHRTCIVNGVPQGDALVSTADYSGVPQVRSDGTNFLTVYVVNDQLTGQFFDSTCAPRGAPFDIAPTSNWTHRGHSLHWDGAQYVLAYTSPVDLSGDIRLLTIQTDAGISAPLVIAAEPRIYELEPRVTSDQPGHWLVAYTRFDDTESVSARRVFYRWVQDNRDAGSTGSDAGNDAGNASNDAGNASNDAGNANNDAGNASNDAGNADAGPAMSNPADAGLDAGAAPAHSLHVGCGCQSNDSEWWGWWALMSCVLFLRSKRP